MIPLAPDGRIEAHQRYLAAALAGVKQAVERHAGLEAPGNTGPEDPASREAVAGMPAPPALETPCDLFGLSPFERTTLLLCTGVELDATFPAFCAAAQTDANRPHATFGLPLAALQGPRWGALSSTAPLRRWQLVEEGPVRMEHLLRAARSQYAQLKKLLTGTEIGGWK